MAIKLQLISFYTLVRHEWIRMLRIATQIFLPPVILTALYFLIFGTLIGNRIGHIAGMSYIAFITPGLIIMSVITNAYSNVSSSLFGMRFQKNIEEILISPMRPSLLLLGCVVGGIIRGFAVAILVYLVSCFFLEFKLHHLTLTLMVVLLAATVFSLAGFLNGMLARTFDDVMIIPTFVLTPLTYLGGVFYATNMLSPFWAKIARLNPVLYIVNAQRYAMLGYTEVNIFITMSIIGLIVLLLAYVNLILLHKGVGLRD